MNLISFLKSSLLLEQFVLYGPRVVLVQLQENFLPISQFSEFVAKTIQDIKIAFSSSVT
jgi:hypothetical protein